MLRSHRFEIFAKTSYLKLVGTPCSITNEAKHVFLQKLYLNFRAKNITYLQHGFNLPHLAKAPKMKPSKDKEATDSPKREEQI